MPAAVPNYLGQEFNTASPGLRFGMYLAIWNHDWSKPKEVSPAIWHAMARLNEDDKSRLDGLIRRQKLLAKAVQADAVLTLDAKALAPFTTGLGNEHPTENGFAFLNPYGLPYLPGSGVKGVLRQAARELASGEWGENFGWTDDKRWGIKKGSNSAIILSITDVLFGSDSDDADQEHVRGVLSFWDVIPAIQGDALQVEIMTPHQKHYYQEGASPHDSGQPLPLKFLTVPPGSRFAFHVLCDLNRLQDIAPELANQGHWKVLLQAAFNHAFDWLGFGAKTAVGYGAFIEDPNAKKAREDEQARKHEEARAAADANRLATLSPEDREWELAQLVISAFRAQYEAAHSAGAFNPGGPFSQQRLGFIKQALGWEESRSRIAAAELLTETATKDWGRPGKKERWKELQDAIAILTRDS